MSETDEGRSGAVDGAAPRSPARTEDVRERPQAPRSKVMRAPLILLLDLGRIAHASDCNKNKHCASGEFCYSSSDS